MNEKKVTTCAEAFFQIYVSSRHGNDDAELEACLKDIQEIMQCNLWIIEASN